MKIGRVRSLALGIALGLAGSPSLAETPDETVSAVPPAGPVAGSKPSLQAEPKLGLDQLLQLPDSYATPGSAPMVGGADAEEWRSRFSDADAQLAVARRGLAEAQRDMEAASASSQWQLSAPGQKADSESSGAGLSQRQRVRRYREDVEEGERRRRALEVEADLAGVPPAWRK